MAVIAEEPILSRLGRVDNMLRQLEEIRGSSNRSPKSSIASTPSSGTLTSEGQVSSIDFSPKCLEKHCRPINRVMTETEIKGTLIERLDQAEERLLKVHVHSYLCAVHGTSLLDGECYSNGNRNCTGSRRPR
ncbi:hypothetical protein JCGZ_16761 [Jatropha curcas]|uniref:Uncharacterized protein n=1 Tax=Jatropha curcas TaxID=180498 RepID=A0A067LH04_JATCU|nr:hypothetical protein JCGZ_16761 [Jatropha curcas]